MTETRELRSVVDAAEQAAAAGNHAAAEQLLREAALLQEASLGPLHPDLANTLNNLGVVCEMTNKVADAEEFYRRAYAIATAVLEPNHPFVATSEKNLRDFCAARGRPIEPPKLPPAAPAEREPPAAASVPLPREHPLQAESQQSSSRSFVRPLPVGVLSASAFLLVMFIGAYFWFSADARDGSPPVSATQSGQGNPTPAPESVPVTPIPVPPVAPPSASGSVAAPESPAPRARPTVAAPAVAEAQLCRELSRGGDWRCDPASSPVDPGTLFFYTRLKAASDTTVQHRWYRGAGLVQAVELRVLANPSNGYRTFSRNTVNAQTAGDWRVELRGENGALLHEVRFVVR